MGPLWFPMMAWLSSRNKKYVFNKKCVFALRVLHQSNPPSEWWSFPWISFQPTGCRVPPKYLGATAGFGDRDRVYISGTGKRHGCLLHLGEVDSLGLELRKKLRINPEMFSNIWCILLRLEDWRHRIAIFLYSFTNVSCHWSKITFLDLTDSPGCFNHNLHRTSCGRFLKWLQPKGGSTTFFLVGLWLLSCVTVDSLLKFGLGITVWYWSSSFIFRFSYWLDLVYTGMDLVVVLPVAMMSWQQPSLDRNLNHFALQWWFLATSFSSDSWIISLHTFWSIQLTWQCNMFLFWIITYFILYIIFVPCKRHFSTGRISLIIFRRGYSLSRVFFHQRSTQYYQSLWM